MERRAAGGYPEGMAKKPKVKRKEPKRPPTEGDEGGGSTYGTPRQAGTGERRDKEPDSPAEGP